MNREQLEAIGKQIVDAAFQVHKELGPGLLESAYEACLVSELIERGLRVERQKTLPIFYNGKKLDAGYRLDLLVKNEIIIELKAIEKFLPIHDAQLISYLKLSKKKLGFLINFNVTLIKNGIKRKVNKI
ncbi:MAG: GxxExxY protein [Candidatus Cloacimonetes bacterium]|nr:GxxExxY protein [Candidatus Cloacimonadota bacterium]